MFDNELVVDNFAGGGGASTGIELGLNRYVDIAINHDPDAIEMHKLNHPETRHYCESIWDVDPVEACSGRPVGLLWNSPDCRHFSRAKGAVPVDKNIRGLAWCVINWASQVPVRILMLENVIEFTTWGPIIDGVPCKKRQGETFDGFIKALTTGLPVEHPAYKDIYNALFRCCYNIKRKLRIYKSIKHGLNYDVDWKIISACDFGAPTIRKRLFLIGRNDGQEIIWPEATHGDNGKLPYKTAADIIDWSIPVKSIFNRKRPLAENTLKRIAKGLEKFVFNGKPFIVPKECSTPFLTEHANASSQRNMPIDEPLRTICAQVKGGHFALVTPIINRQFGQSESNPVTEGLGSITVGDQDNSDIVSNHITKHYTGVSGADICKPHHTVTQNDHNALVTSHMVKLRGTNLGHGTDEPVHTISAGGLHIGEVRAFMIKYYGTNYGHSCDQPLQTITSKHRFGLVTVEGEDYQIVDIGMRMLEPHELFAAQGFPGDYKFTHDNSGKRISKAKQVARCGNAVCPPVAQALVEANFPALNKLEQSAA
ncbi:DNA cytosine methyltransferase [Algicola sagamiensis]|uniref:DNA cytosine methyltransferase n=1 Tax=Algicola sagamiensis TaxID=163869 RepID=UPI0003A660E5|nr:DNA cytosine methyltransferase [Algicola sagamiensis]